MGILLIEDEAEVAAYIRKGLEGQGYSVDHAADGAQGLAMAQQGGYRLLIVDRMLPGMEGLEVVRRLRAAGDQVPVLILSALSEVDDRVEGLRAGSDDYLVKPFACSELLARAEALMRRSAAGADVVVRLGVADLEMDLLSRTVTRAGKRINLQAREFALLEYLLRHQGHIVTRAMLLEHVWHYHFDPQTNVIDVHVSRLRRKVDDGHTLALIKTVRGSGYMIDGEA